MQNGHTLIYTPHYYSLCMGHTKAIKHAVLLPSASEKTSGAHRGPMFGHECNVFWPSEMIAGAAGLGSCENVLFITPLNNVVYVNLCIVSPYGHL